MNDYPDWLEKRIVWGKVTQDQPSASPPIKAITPEDPCQDCLKTLDKTRVVWIKTIQHPFKFLQHQCKNCKLYQDPDTGKFCLDNQQLREVLAQKKPKKK